MRKIFSRINFKILAPSLLLTLSGVVLILSFCLKKGDFLLLKKQLTFWILGVVIFLILSVADLRFLRRNASLVFFLYCLAFLFLLGLLFFGEKVRGVRGWYKLGPFSFDPVPISAVILIIVLSKYFALRHVYLKSIRPLLGSLFYLLPLFVLVVMQPDLGSALLLVFVWLGVILFSGIQWKHLLILFLIFTLSAVLSWQFYLKDYQKMRIISFLKGGDPQGISWNVIQSKIAIGSGGILGKGFGKGSQFHYGFLPEPLTDFIFSALCEEFGFLGGLFVIGLFGFLFWQLMKIALLVEDNFTRLFAAGFAFLLLGQSFINVGMTLGLLPVIGVPLPFVSYGGSHLLGFYFALGVLNSLSRSFGF